jgi:hypothetical protein
MRTRNGTLAREAGETVRAPRACDYTPGASCPVRETYSVYPPPNM